MFVYCYALVCVMCVGVSLCECVCVFVCVSQFFTLVSTTKKRLQFMWNSVGFVLSTNANVPDNHE